MHETSKGERWLAKLTTFWWRKHFLRSQQTLSECFFFGDSVIFRERRHKFLPRLFNWEEAHVLDFILLTQFIGIVNTRRRLMLIASDHLNVKTLLASRFLTLPFIHNVLSGSLGSRGKWMSVRTNLCWARKSVRINFRRNKKRVENTNVPKVCEIVLSLPENTENDIAYRSGMWVISPTSHCTDDIRCEALKLWSRLEFFYQNI